ncbi:TetR/AcrR family transcriptional regulator C-terminal domain-containing protein [Streptomyces sp. NPDC005989]|uniref:TetR/AcrR family transcriptional regulator C-terminal domain-containing protein n=1 Tax=Streptomyces sp. NPDC005989 TaxID=3156727 RepID=UPI0033CF9C74
MAAAPFAVGPLVLRFGDGVLDLASAQVAAATFQRLAEEGLLRIDDALLAANHFSGLLLWIPVNKAMFTGRSQHTEADLDRYAAAGTRVFLAAYR